MADRSITSPSALEKSRMVSAVLSNFPEWPLVVAEMICPRFEHSAAVIEGEGYGEDLSRFDWKIAKMISENASKRTRNSGLRSSTGICVSASQA